MLDRREQQHDAVAVCWRRLADTGEQLVTTNYVTLEAMALVQRRLGIEALRDLHDAILSQIEIIWIDREVHERALAALLAALRKQLSLVDCTSFEIMRFRGLRTAFALDRHFSEQGFSRIP